MKDITYSLDEIIEIIKKITDKNYYVTLEGVNFKLEQLILLQKKFNENSRLLEGFSIQIEENLSMRRALIALLQEKYYTRKTYEGIEIKLSQLQNIANSRFVIKNKDTRNFKTPQDIHPKNPCLHYEDDIDKKKHYKTALNILIELNVLYYTNSNAHENIKFIYEDISNC